MKGLSQTGLLQFLQHPAFEALWEVPNPTDGHSNSQARLVMNRPRTSELIPSSEIHVGDRLMPEWKDLFRRRNAICFLPLVWRVTDQRALKCLARQEQQQEGWVGPGTFWVRVCRACHSISLTCPNSTGTYSQILASMLIHDSPSLPWPELVLLEFLLGRDSLDKTSAGQREALSTGISCSE